MKTFHLSFCSVVLIIALISDVNAQVTTLPKEATKPNKLPATNLRPVITKDTTKPKTEYRVVPYVATASSRIATADELYLGQGSFLIRTAKDYRYLTVKDEVPREQSIAFMWSHIENPNQQQWRFILQDNGYYKIRSESGLFLSQKRIIAPTTEPASNEDSQLWQLIETGDGYYHIKSKTNKFLHLHDRRNRDGGIVTFSTTATATEQKWHLIKWTNDSRRTTSFIPETHAFEFTNRFSGEDIIRWGGLCGGMVYTALDYFRRSMPIPLQSYMPANRTALQSYIYERQNHSIWDVNSSWTDLEVSYNTRGGELFRWGIEGTGSGRFKEVQDAVNANTPKPLGLFAGGVRGKDDHDGGRHVVLAVGYSVGRYRGDPNIRSEEIKIHVYNPNRGKIMTTLVPDRMKQCYFEVESGNAWRTYFVNNRYDGSHTPPAAVPNFPEGEAEGSVRHLYAEFVTGGDDLRGGNDNVSITIEFMDGSRQGFPNVNNGARWADNTIQVVHLELSRAVRKEDIRYFMITTSFGSGEGSDDWNLDAFYVSSGMGGNWYAYAEPAGGSPYVYRFSGDQRRIRHAVQGIR